MYQEPRGFPVCDTSCPQFVETDSSIWRTRSERANKPDCHGSLEGRDANEPRNEAEEKPVAASANVAVTNKGSGREMSIQELKPRSLLKMAICEALRVEVRHVRELARLLE